MEAGEELISFYFWDVCPKYRAGMVKRSCKIEPGPFSLCELWCGMATG